MLSSLDRCKLLINTLLLNVLGLRNHIGHVLKNMQKMPDITVLQDSSIYQILLLETTVGQKHIQWPKLPLHVPYIKIFAPNERL